MATDRVFLTGGAGFVGSHVLRELLARGYPVRALIRGARRPAPREGLELVEGDLLTPGTFARALHGCRYLVHAAAAYSFAPRDRARLWTVNVTGTEGLMCAAHLAGIERAVLTSSSSTVEHDSVRAAGADETSYPGHGGAVERRDYHGSKLAQERAAFAGRVPLVAVLPTAPVGPGDWKPTPTGKLVRDFLLGAVVAKAPGSGGMNLVAVEDVARAHVAALQRGRPGERYLIGGENLSMDAIWALLSEATGRPMPRWRAPYAAAVAAGAFDELRCRMTNATPMVPMEGVRMARDRMYADSGKAARELGHVPSPVRGAIERAVAYYRMA